MKLVSFLNEHINTYNIDTIVKNPTANIFLINCGNCDTFFKKWIGMNQLQKYLFIV